MDKELFRPNLGEIRKLTIVNNGDVFNGFNFVVGQKFRVNKKTNESIIISRIVRDDHAYILHNEMLYVVYATKEGDDSGVEFCWQYLSGVPVRAECFVNQQ